MQEIEGLDHDAAGEQEAEVSFSVCIFFIKDVKISTKPLFDLRKMHVEAWISLCKIEINFTLEKRHAVKNNI